MLNAILFITMIISISLVLYGLFLMFVSSMKESNSYNGLENEKVPCSIDDYYFCDNMLKKN